MSTIASSPAAGLPTSYDGPPRICVVGAGFGGLYTALRLETLTWPRGKKPQITLIDPSARFVFKPLLYDLLNGSATADEVAPLFSELLAPYPTTFIQGRATAVEERGPAAAAAAAGPATAAPNGAAGVVTLDNGERIEYDWLLLSLGADIDPKGVPGVQEHAIPFIDYNDAVRTNDRVTQLEAAEGIPVVAVVGAGYSGVEVALVISERFRGRAMVKLITPRAEIMEQLPQGQREAAAKQLRAKGVDVLAFTKVKEVRAGPGEGVKTLELVTNPPAGAAVAGSGSSTLDVDLVLWTAGCTPVTKQRKGFPFPQSARGTIVVEPTLRVVEHPRVFAVGDVSGAETGPSGDGRADDLPATAQVAFQQSDYAAWNIWAAINGRPLLPFRYQHMGDMMTLGQLNAAAVLPFSLPEPLRDGIQKSLLAPLFEMAGVNIKDKVTLDGPAAQFARRFLYLYRQPTHEQRMNVAASWLQQGATAASKLFTRQSNRSETVSG